MKTMNQKKHLLVALAFAGLTNCLSAQTSIQLSNSGTATTLTANEIIYMTVAPETNAKVTIDVKNTSNSTKSYVAKRYDILLNADATSTAQAYFCIAGSCYGPPTMLSPTPLTLTSQQSASELQGPYQMLVADLDEASTMGPSIVKYTFQNTANPADSVQITIKYNEQKVTGIASQSKSKLSLEVAPNPTTGNIILKASEFPDNAAITVVDGLGKVVCEKAVLKSDAEAGVKIDLSNNLPGIYYLVLSSQNSVTTKRIVLN